MGVVLPDIQGGSPSKGQQKNLLISLKWTVIPMENQEVYYISVLLFMNRISNEQFNLRFFSS